MHCSGNSNYLPSNISFSPPRDVNAGCVLKEPGDARELRTIRLILWIPPIAPSSTTNRHTTIPRMCGLQTRYKRCIKIPELLIRCIGLLLLRQRNEFSDFQVHVQAGASAYFVKCSAVSDLVNARTGTHISNLTNIIVYREAYMKITTRSNANGTLGLTPDILIPAVDPYYHQVRNAFPHTMAAHQNQSAWIDVVIIPPVPPRGIMRGQLP